MRIVALLALVGAAWATAPPRIAFHLANGTLEWGAVAAMTANDEGTLFVTAGDVRVVNTTSGVNASVSTDTAGVDERRVARDLEARRYAVPLPGPTSTWTPGPSVNLTTTCSATPAVMVLPREFTSTAAGYASTGTSRLAVFSAAGTCSVSPTQNVVSAATPLLPGSAAWAVDDSAPPGLAALVAASGASFTPGLTSWDSALPDGTTRRYLLRTAYNQVALIPTTCPVASFALAPLGVDAPAWAAEPNALPCVGVIATAAGTPHGAGSVHVATAGWASSDGDSAVFTA